MAEVVEYDEFIEATGATEGWHPDDHAEFLRILTSCRGDYSHAILIATDQLPSISRDAIVQHARCSHALVPFCLGILPRYALRELAV